MTTQLSPTPVFKAWDNQGVPLSGGKLFTYIAGSTTKQASFTDSTGGTPNTNPVILNYRGEANVWLDPTKVYKLVLAPSTDTDPPTNPFWTVDQISGGSLSPTGSIIPTVDNLFTLGSTSFSWANVYVGPNHAPVLDATSGNIGYYARTAAEIAASVTPTNFSYPEGDIRRYGATIAATDNSAAINAAFSLIGVQTYIPAGTWKVATNLNIPACTGIFGAGFLSSIIKTVGCTIGLSVSASNDMLLRDFQMLGDATAGARGIVYGDGASTLNSVLSRNLWVTGYTGANAMGIDIRNATETTFINCNINTCTLGGRCKVGTTASTPTTVNFYACNFSTCSTQGFVVQQGYSIGFHATVFQNNTNEGLSVVPDATHSAPQVTIDGDCWFEGNWGANPGQFQLFADSSVANLPVMVSVASAMFRGVVGTANAMKFNGTFVTFNVSEDVVVPNMGGAQPGTITVLAGAIGQIKLNSTLLPSYSTIVTDAGGTATNVYDAYNAWTAYVPTYASDIGNQAATFSGGGTVTTTLAHYKRTGKILHITLQFSGTLNAVTPNYISVTTPGIPLQNDQTYSPACISNAGTFETGVVRSQAAGTLRFHRANFVNFGSGAAILGIVSLVVETA